MRADLIQSNNFSPSGWVLESRIDEKIVQKSFVNRNEYGFPVIIHILKPNTEPGKSFWMFSFGVVGVYTHMCVWCVFLFRVKKNCLCKFSNV